MDSAPKINLLVVEDEALIAESLRLTLEDLGYGVLATCYTFAEAQQAFAGPRPDLVLLDINLGGGPQQSGLELAQQLRDAQGPPFLFLTAYNDFDTIRQAARLQPSGYLIKPVNSAALFAAIQTAIERAAAHQAAPLPDPNAPAAPVPEFFFVKRGAFTHKLYWRDVASLEAGKNYVTLRAPAQRLSHAIRGSLYYVLDQLLPPGLQDSFIRVNRRTSLNAAFITGYDDEHVYCAGEAYENGRMAQEQLQRLRLK
ncbi:response regulator [Hymenobacter ruber]